MDSYYRRIRDMREDNDMTQKEVSDYLGMKQSQYSRYERGHRDIPTDVLIKLAFLFDKFYIISDMNEVNFLFILFIFISKKIR